MFFQTQVLFIAQVQMQSSGLPTLLQGLTRRAHRVVPSRVRSCCLSPYRQASAVTVTKQLIAEILATTAHLFSVKLLLFFVCPLQKRSLLLSERNHAPSPLPPEYTTPCRGAVPVPSPSPLCLMECHHPTVGRAVLVSHPWHLLSSPSLVGMGCFFFLSL